MSPYTNGSSAVRGGYLAKDTGLYSMLRLRDTFSRLIRTAAPTEPRPVHRVVVAVGGHLGDAVIATAVLPALSTAFPGVEIGIVCPTPSAAIFESHPRVTRIHRFDHWFSSPALPKRSSLFSRWRRSRQSGRQAAAELAAIGYDVAIDLYPFFPNHARLFLNAGIPVRVGYASGGDGPLLTHAVAWTDTRAHTAHQHLALLAWSPDIDARTWTYDLPDVRGDGATDRLLAEHGLTARDYIVLHVGTGNPLKAWPEASWRALSTKLGESTRPLRVVLTGAGAPERRLIDSLIPSMPGAVSLCDRTTWQTLRGVIANARVVIGHDSVAAHLAAASGVPCIAIMAAMSDPEHWRPGGAMSIALTKPVACAPCFRSTGCAEMSCVRGVTVDRVDAALAAALGE